VKPVSLRSSHAEIPGYAERKDKGASSPAEDA